MGKKISFDLPEKIDAKENDYLFVKTSQISGANKGLFTAIPIFKNEVISLFKGVILSDNEAKKRAVQNLDGYFINMLDGSVMDSKNTVCFAKYANDAEAYKKPTFKNNSKITLSETNKVCLVALRDIKTNEEIFCSYGKAYWKNIRQRDNFNFLI